MKRAIPVLGVVLFLGGAWAVTRDRAQAGQAPIQHRVSVTLKLVQVFVADAKGAPVTDLVRDDFVLYDNGKLQTITDFEKHVLAVPAPASPGITPAAPAPVPARAAAPLLNRKFIFIVDYVRNGHEGVMKAKRAALEFLDTKVRPEDEVALFTLSGLSGLTLHQYFTTDHAKVRTAFKKLREVPGGNVSAPPGGELLGMELMAEQLFARHGAPAGPTRRNLFEEIAEWAKALRAIPGQKNVILFTMGFGDDVVRRGNPDQPLFEMMAKALASANAPVFTVDTTPQLPPGRAVDAKLPSGTLSVNSLARLSRITGGTYLGAVDYAAKIAEVIHDATASYYVLGYVVPAAWDGKFHNIKVEVGRPGANVHAQSGYFNPLPFDKLSPIEKHLHLLDVALADAASSKRDLDLPLTAVPFAGAKDANTLLLSEISVQAVRDAVGDRTEFISLIFDGNRSLVDGKRVEVDWKTFRAGPLYQYAAVALAPGAYECRAVIRNLDDGRSAVGVCSVDVPGPAAAGPALSPPFFLVPGSKGVFLNVAARMKGGSDEGISISTIFPFPADAYVPLVGPLGPGAAALYAVVRSAGMGGAEDEWELSAWLFAESGEERPDIVLEVVNSYSREDADFHLLKVELPELAPGRFRLAIRAVHALTGAAVTTAGWFSVGDPQKTNPTPAPKTSRRES
jgi:VWFA-related protein